MPLQTFERGSTLPVLVCLLVLSSATVARAHVGDHDASAGGPAHVWTEPGTGRQVPGWLSVLRDGHVFVEDLTGRRHNWRVADLVEADRAVAEMFRDRLARRSLMAGRFPAARNAPSTAAPVTAVALVAVLALLVARRGWPAGRGALMASALAAVAGGLACGSSDTTSSAAAAPTSPSPPVATAPSLASLFTAFPQHVRTRDDSGYLYVESDGLADHQMMTGIRSWQQQVPLPADYTGANAWRLPRAPRLAAQPVSARTGLFRGAIALAVNGVPIFNALNNRGDDAFLAGELDEFGGHAGRADDYHYHTAPLFLSAAVGATQPIAVALDGFLLYGALEPDGAPMRALDDYNGHADTALGYHYHGTRTYPYINGGMKGEVQVSDQVEPQPSLRPVRPALTPLAGATITRHAATGSSSWTLEYQISGRTSRVDYRIEGTRVTFVFTDPSGASRTEVYTR